MAYDYNASCWEDARDEVANLALLGQGWDGEGGMPAKANLIEAAMRLLDLAESKGYPPPTYVYLTSGGTPMIEWHMPGHVASANVRKTDRADVLYRVSGRQPEMDYVDLTDFGTDTTVTPNRAIESSDWSSDDAYALAS